MQSIESLPIILGNKLYGNGLQSSAFRWHTNRLVHGVGPDGNLAAAATAAFHAYPSRC